MADLKIALVQGKAATIKTPLLVLQFFEKNLELSGSGAELDHKLGGVIKRIVGHDFNGKKDEALVIYPAPNTIEAERVLLVGVGKREDYTLERLRRGVGVAVRQAEKLGVSELALLMDHAQKSSERMGAEFAARGAVDGAVLAAWDFKEYKSRKPDDPPPRSLKQVTLVARTATELKAFQAAAEPAAAIARATNLARDLQFRPGNEITPSFLAKTAQQIGRKHGMKVTVLDREAIKKEGMGALLAVAQGSQEEPRFIIIEYMKGAKSKKPLVLIGKGVTFDSGGISIKPAERMEDMKYDMSGAAAVLGAMSAIGELGLKVNVVALVPSTENMPSGAAYKPGDVIRAHSGKTIEIVNTDAEGRLILADALSYAQRFEPAAMVNAATLTGAVVVALGQVAIGLMGNDGDLIDEIRAAGQRVGERCWPLPLWDEYRELIDSNIADMKNSGGRAAGSITGGWFLKEFAGDTPWVHLDIAGTAYRDEAAPYLRKGATGVPTRLFIEWVRTRAEA
jgi:leucyl aminopeptidase